MADIFHFVRKAVPPGVGTTPHCRPTRVHGEPHTLVTTMVLASDLSHLLYAGLVSIGLMNYIKNLTRNILLKH